MTRLRIVVVGYVVRGPLGALSWHHLQYLMGLRALGHDVWFAEDSDDYESCYDPSTGAVSGDPSYGLRYTARVFERVGLSERWAYFDAHSSTWHGPSADRVRRAIAHADVLLDVSSVNPPREWWTGIPVRVLVDTDPAFTQVRHLRDAAAREAALAHTHFFTFAERFGRPDCDVPDDGLPWQPTRQPVFLDAWAPGARPAPDAAFTTVMQWESYPAVTWNGAHFGMKSTSFDAVIDLPHSTSEVLELALGSTSAPRDTLAERGWRIEDPEAVTLDPWVYQAYVRRSKGELSVAKHGYVVSKSGWFSERSAGYLASGRPVVTQATGFERELPTGEGLLPFTDLESARVAIGEVSANWERHSRAARALAEDCFDSRGVLTSLLGRL